MLTDANMKIPKRGKIFSINEGYTQYWDDDVKEYVRQCKYPEVSFEIDCLWETLLFLLLLLLLILLLFPSHFREVRRP